LGLVRQILTEPFRFRAGGVAAGAGTAAASFTNSWRRDPGIGVWHAPWPIAHAVSIACAEGLVVIAFFAAAGYVLERRERRPPS
jgi:hypothetical protein